ncbi:MAG: stage II sporulation protein M [Clostridiales bacterium]|nr:stage II sporulation protein M [Eubacteriales bacterium]MDH7565393.1 stage II sporulation protein M [Clostridiales bacterium]
MIFKIRDTLRRHVKNNSKKYFLLLLVFIAGVSAGAFTVNGLSTIQREELANYFQGFLQLFDSQNMECGELLKVSILENARLVIALWVLGVTIIGIPFIYVLIGIRGFITGFTSGFIIETLGLKGVLFIFFALLPKEIVIIPFLIAMGVNGINFSLDIIKSKSIRHLSKESLKTNFLAYCMTTLFFTGFIFIGVLIEAYIIPVFIRIILPLVTS